MQEALVLIENSATNHVRVKLSDTELQGLIQHSADRAAELEQENSIPMCPYILVIMPYARWERIEPHLDTDRVVHLDEMTTANLFGFVCAAAFVDDDLLALDNHPWAVAGAMSSVKPTGSLQSLGPVDGALSCGLAVMQNYSSDPLPSPLGMCVIST